MTTEQASTLRDLLFANALVLDRVYFDFKRGSINFRTRWVIEGTSFKFSTTTMTQNRYAIMDDGTIVDRNTDRRFVGVKP